MASPQTAPAQPALNAASANDFRERTRHAVAMAASTALLLWPAFFNRLPLLYPDSMTYLGDGRTVARAVFLHKLSEYYGMRSFYYSLGILPLHWNVTPWPVVIFQSALTAYVLWMVVRSVSGKRSAAQYLLLTAVLAGLTSVSWYSSLIMPDILGPLLYLSIYLLVFARESVSRAERIFLSVLVWWSIASHATHLLLASGIVVILGVAHLFRWEALRERRRAILQIALLVGAAAGSQLALHGYLYGRPSLNGDRPPFLVARVIADGPGWWYLQKNCANLDWVICEHMKELPQEPDKFLWGEDGIYQNLSPDDMERLQQEEMLLVKATLRAYPRAEISRALRNTSQQFVNFGLYDLGASGWIAEQYPVDFPGSPSRYTQTRQGRDELRLDFFSSVLYWTVSLSAMIVIGYLFYAWRHRISLVLGLALVVVPTVFANAFLGGALSIPDDRFQCRIIWLVPLMAGLCALDFMQRRRLRQRN